MQLAVALVYGWRMTTAVTGRITILSLVFAATLVYGQCMASEDCCYIWMEITIPPLVLAAALMYSQCMTNTYGRYIGGGTIKATLDIHADTN